MSKWISRLFSKSLGLVGTAKISLAFTNFFEIFDKQGVGSFGVEEFAEVCESVGERFSPAEIEQMIEYADKDKDGRINFD